MNLILFYFIVTEVAVGWKLSKPSKFKVIKIIFAQKYCQDGETLMVRIWQLSTANG